MRASCNLNIESPTKSPSYSSICLTSNRTTTVSSSALHTYSSSQPMYEEETPKPPHSLFYIPCFAIVQMTHHHSIIAVLIIILQVCSSFPSSPVSRKPRLRYIYGDHQLQRQTTVTSQRRGGEHVKNSLASPALQVFQGKLARPWP